MICTVLYGLHLHMNSSNGGRMAVYIAECGLASVVECVVEWQCSRVWSSGNVAECVVEWQCSRVWSSGRVAEYGRVAV